MITATVVGFRQAGPFAVPNTLGETAEALAAMLTASPNMRARLFANPTKEVGKHLPPRKYWDYGIDPGSVVRHPIRFFTQRYYYRAQLAKCVLEKLAERTKAETGSRRPSTRTVFAEFFEPIVRVSQRSFNGVFGLSLAVFCIGCALIITGIVLAFTSGGETNPTILAGAFGATGAISALGSVYALATRGISSATTDHAKLRLVLTGLLPNSGSFADSRRRQVTASLTTFKHSGRSTK